MSELVRIIWGLLTSDEGPDLYSDDGEPLTEAEALQVAQQIAEKVIASGWPRTA